jgi:hypothetical protein
MAWGWVAYFDFPHVIQDVHFTIEIFPDIFFVFLLHILRTSVEMRTIFFDKGIFSTSNFVLQVRPFKKFIIYFI